jgi:hypothetical protein
MKKPIFLPQDFQQKLDFFNAQHVAEIANDIFESWYKNNIKPIKEGKEKGWIKVGEYTVCEFIDYEGKPCLWIEKEDGEAMTIDIDEIWEKYF